MDIVLRSAIVYLAVLVLVRVTGKRTLAQITVFDFVLLLVIAEATQQALIGDDYSITTALLVILTLVSIDRVAAFVSSRSESLDRVFNDAPLILVEDGEVLKDRMDKLRVSIEDILGAGRAGQGIERLEQIKYAVIERNGSISIIPWTDQDG
jgi:uncharacterized membrane protein YcaP (DUF421 family)